jgi:uncharacterized membrane protein YgcG
VSGKDTFAKTTREIAEYVGRDFDDAGEFRTGMVEMSLPPIIEPAAPEDGNPISFELWRMARRTFEKQTEARRRNSSRVYALVLGQCSQALRNWIEAHERWGRINERSDVMELLQLIQTCMIQRQTRQKPTHSLLDAETQVYTFRQRHLANNEYYEKFKDLITNAERLGSDIGAHTDRVDAILEELAVDPDMPTEGEREQARERAKDQFLAVMFLINSDRGRFGTLVRDVENEYTRGSDTYPSTLSAAYDYLVNYRGGDSRGSHDPHESGLSYYTTGDDEEEAGRGRGGRGGRGRGRGSGRGRGGGGGRGGGRGQGTGGGTPADETTTDRGRVHSQADDDDAMYLTDNVDNLDQVESYPAAHFVGYTSESTNNALLLDSCSTVNLIASKHMLRDIHMVPTTMHIRCNAGITTTNLKGWLGDFPEPVWYNPNGVANILSLFIVKRYYHVRYDSAQHDTITVTKPDGNTWVFAPTGKGLYALTNLSTDWAHITTVADRKEEYTKREYRDAVLARKIQNIVMFPGVRALTKIVDSQFLANCPIGRADISAAERIFGPNLGALKGKTTNQASVPVGSRIDGVPPDLLQRYQNIILAIDIMFVNKIPFLITTSRGLHFGTVENLANRQVPTVHAALKRVLAVYHRRGFRVTTLLADPEFQPLQEIFAPVSFNLCAQNEHVPEIERYIRTVKDRTRSGYNSLPFERIPRLVLIRLVANAVFWLNAFPHADGVSDTLSPRYLLTGKHLDYRKHVRLEFGSYVQTHEEHTNDMLPRTIGAICLGPSGNEQGGHYFMSLMTGRRLLRDRWTELPMPLDAITRVGQLGRQQRMPKTLTFADRFGFEIPDADDDVDDDHDSAYDPAEDEPDAAHDDVDDDVSVASDVASTVSHTSSHSSHGGSSAGDDDDRGDIIAQPLPGLTAGVDNGDSEDEDDEDDDSEDDDAHDRDNDTDGGDDEEPDDDPDPEPNGDDNGDPIPEINIPDTIVSTPPAAPPRNTGVGGENAGVGNEQGQTMTNARNAGVASDDMSKEPDQDNQIAQVMNDQYGARQHDINLRERKPRKYDHLYGSDHMLATFEEPMGELFMTEQMSLKKGLKLFGKDGANAVVAEMRQLDYRNVIKPVQGKDLTREQKRRALNYLMYLKQKRCGRIKARGCADGRKQRLYKNKDEVSSPTVSTEAVFLTSVIEAQERRKVMTIDIPGAFMHVDIDELIHVRLEGPMAELLTRVDPAKYRTYMSTERGKQVMYVELQKALYGTLQAAMLFWENLTRPCFFGRI